MTIWPTDNIWMSNFNIYFISRITGWCEQKEALLFLSEDARQFYLPPDSSWGKGEE